MKIMWTIGQNHPIYGKVVMMGSLQGEAYRWFDKNGVISMIPLSVLLEQRQGPKRIS